jgi:hypothetical protein
MTHRHSFATVAIRFERPAAARGSPLMAIQRAALRVLALGATWIAALCAPASGQQRIGSFVSGERPMYIEISPLVELSWYHFELRNLPKQTGVAYLILSDAVAPADLSSLGIPGFLGPDLNGGIVVPLTSFSFNGVCPAGLAGATVYMQAIVAVPGGARLSSMVTAHVLAQGTDPGEGGGSISFPLPLTTQQVLPSAVDGDDWTQGPVRVGVPLPIGKVFDTNGVPQLTVTGGTSAAQFATLSKWPDGSVKWALADFLADVPADQAVTTYAVDQGGGNFGGSDLASTSGSATTVDTGAIRFVLDASQPDLFSSLQKGGVEWFDLSAGNVPRFWDDGDAAWTWHKLDIWVRRNGPVRAEIEVDGSFTRSTSVDDADRVYVRMLVEAWKNSSAIRVTASLRDTSVLFPEHLLFRGFTWSAKLAAGGAYTVTVPEPTSSVVASATYTGTLASSSDDARLFQGYARTPKYELADDANWSRYVPFIERFADDDYALEGTQIRIASTWYTGDSSNGFWTDQTVYAEPSFMEFDAAGGSGILFGLEHANMSWPASLWAGGDGSLEVGLLPHKDPADTYPYPLTYASCETRTFFLELESTPSAAPITDAKRFDFPLAARADLWVYNQADVWQWRLVTSDDIDAFCAHSGLRTPHAPATNAARVVYRYSNATGGGNNSWGETQKLIQWLREGSGGAWLSSYLEARYKADKMAWTIDDDVLSKRQAIRNPDAVVTPKADFYDDSKHMFMQAVADWAFTHGDLLLQDSARSFREMLLDPVISPNVQPGGNFVSGTYTAGLQDACAILDLEPNAALEAWTHEIFDEWAHVTYKQSNRWGIDTSTLGWQASLHTPTSSPSDPDGWMISWSAGKASDKAQYGYMSQPWTDVRGGAQAFHRYVWHLRQIAPGDRLIGDLLARADDWYHFARRGMPDDFCDQTGEHYIVDIVKGDANDPDIDPLGDPGDDVDFPNPSGYADESVVNFLLAAKPSESAYSYGVELDRSFSAFNYDACLNDPILQHFLWRYLVHYGLKKP